MPSRRGPLSDVEDLPGGIKIDGGVDGGSDVADVDPAEQEGAGADRHPPPTGSDPSEHELVPAPREVFTPAPLGLEMGLSWAC